MDDPSEVTEKVIIQFTPKAANDTEEIEAPPLSLLSVPVNTTTKQLELLINKLLENVCIYLITVKNSKLLINMTNISVLIFSQESFVRYGFYLDDTEILVDVDSA